jgi:hypothetical protein
VLSLLEERLLQLRFNANPVGVDEKEAVEFAKAVEDMLRKLGLGHDRLQPVNDHRRFFHARYQFVCAHLDRGRDLCQPYLDLFRRLEHIRKSLTPFIGRILDGDHLSTLPSPPVTALSQSDGSRWHRHREGEETFRAQLRQAFHVVTEMFVLLWPVSADAENERLEAFGMKSRNLRRSNRLNMNRIRCLNSLY